MELKVRGFFRLDEQKTARNPLSLDMGSRAENRGTHGDSSFMLNEESLSSENPPAFSRGECQIHQNNKYVALGRYKTYEEALARRQAAEKRIFRGVCS